MRVSNFIRKGAKGRYDWSECFKMAFLLYECVCCANIRRLIFHCLGTRRCDKLSNIYLSSSEPVSSLYTVFTLLCSLAHLRGCSLVYSTVVLLTLPTESWEVIVKNQGGGKILFEPGCQHRENQPWLFLS